MPERNAARIWPSSSWKARAVSLKAGGRWECRQPGPKNSTVLAEWKFRDSAAVSAPSRVLFWLFPELLYDSFPVARRKYLLRSLIYSVLCAGQSGEQALTGFFRQLLPQPPLGIPEMGKHHYLALAIGTQLGDLSQKLG